MTSRAGRRPSIGCWKKSPSCRLPTCCGDAEERPAGSGNKLVAEFFADRNLDFIKMLAQRLIRQGQVVVFVGCGGAQPSLVFAQTPGLSNDMGALMKETMQKLGTRGGGNRDMAQGGAPTRPARNRPSATPQAG